MPFKTITFLIPILLITITAHAEQPYNTPPAIVSYCEQGFIGYEYSPLKARRCHRLWSQWTREILLEESDYFSHL